MHTAALTTTSETWVTIQHVATIVGAAFAAFAAARVQLNSGKINQIQVNTNGNLTALVAQVETLTATVKELTGERDQARAAAAGVATTTTTPGATT